MSAFAPAAAPGAVQQGKTMAIRPEHLRYLKDPEFVEFARRHLVKKKKPQIRWTAERVQFLKDNYPHMILPRLTRAFNEAFDVYVTEKAIGFQLSWREIRKTVRPTVGSGARTQGAAAA